VFGHMCARAYTRTHRHTWMRDPRTTRARIITLDARRGNPPRNSGYGSVPDGKAAANATEVARFRPKKSHTHGASRNILDVPFARSTVPSSAVRKRINDTQIVRLGSRRRRIVDVRREDRYSRDQCCQIVLKIFPLTRIPKSPKNP